MRQYIYINQRPTKQERTVFAKRGTSWERTPKALPTACQSGCGPTGTGISICRRSDIGVNSMRCGEFSSAVRVYNRGRIQRSAFGAHVQHSLCHCHVGADAQMRFTYHWTPTCLSSMSRFLISRITLRAVRNTIENVLHKISSATVI